MKIHIYQIWFPTSKKSYVGQTAYLEKRMQQHLCSGSLVCKALYKYDDWQVSILHTCKTRDEANRIEIEEIRNFNSVAPNGYNLTHGGEGGDTISNHPNRKIIIEKFSKSHQGTNLGNKNAAGNKNRQGCHFSKESIEKISKGMLGNKNAKGHGGPKGIKRPDVAKRNKENNPMKDPKIAAKVSKNHKGKKHLYALGEKNVSHRTDVKIKQLTNKLKKLEKELKGEL